MTHYLAVFIFVASLACLGGVFYFAARDERKRADRLRKDISIAAAINGVMKGGRHEDGP
jgi:hypothetical protein